MIANPYTPLYIKKERVYTLGRLINPTHGHWGNYPNNLSLKRHYASKKKVLDEYDNVHPTFGGYQSCKHPYLLVKRRTQELVVGNFAFV